MIEPYQYQLRQLWELPTTNQDTVRRYQSVPVYPSTLRATADSCQNSAESRRPRSTRSRSRSRTRLHSHLLELQHKRCVLG